jgi:sec-independent protein translocase protein TatC
MALPETPPNQMTFWEHLQELRVRLTRSLLIVAAGFGLTYFFRLKIWEFAQKPFLDILAKQLGKPVAQLEPFAYTSLTEPFFSLMRLSLWAAAFLVAPFLFHQLWAFIRPGLLPKERRFAIPFVFFTSLCFLGGAWFAYRYAFTILAGILSQEATAAFLRPNLHINEYLDLFIYTIVGTGLMFELPVLFFLLAKLRVVTAGGMLRFWRHAVIGIVVAAAFLTPGDVIVTTIFFSVVLLALYFVSVLVAWLGQPKALPKPADED